MGVETLILGLVFNIYTLDNIDFFYQRANNNKNMTCVWEYVGKKKPDPQNPSLTFLGNVYYKQKCVTKELDKW
jgi:hypothetical protein